GSSILGVTFFLPRTPFRGLVYTRIRLPHATIPRSLPQGRTEVSPVFTTERLPCRAPRPAERGAFRTHGQTERTGFPATDVRHHLAPGRGQDDAHGEAAALRRRHSDGWGRQGPG